MTPDAAILLVGAGGQLGRALRVVAGVRDLPLHALDHAALDVTDAGAVAAAVDHYRPAWVVNAAAYTAVDRAESEPVRAHAVNADGAANLARAAHAVNARLVHVSTDFVFDGERSRPYRPDDAPNPVNVYGASKLAGERAVREILGEDALVLRTAWVYSLQGPSFLTTMLRLLRERDEVHVVEDQVGTPTSAASVAEAVLAAMEQNLRGVHHCTDAGIASWYDFAVAIAELARAEGLLEEHAPLVPIPAAEFPAEARRPAYSVLDRAASRAVLGLAPVHWRAALAACLAGGIGTSPAPAHAGMARFRSR